MTHLELVEELRAKKAWGSNGEILEQSGILSA